MHDIIRTQDCARPGRSAVIPGGPGEIPAIPGAPCGQNGANSIASVQYGNCIELEVLSCTSRAVYTRCPPQDPEEGDPVVRVEADPMLEQKHVPCIYRTVVLAGYVVCVLGIIVMHGVTYTAVRQG